jgi:hypothetical protein
MSEQTAATIHVGVNSSAVASVSSCAIQPPSGLHYSSRKCRNKGNVNRLASPGRKRFCYLALCCSCCTRMCIYISQVSNCCYSAAWIAVTWQLGCVQLLLLHISRRSSWWLQLGCVPSFHFHLHIRGSSSSQRPGCLRRADLPEIHIQTTRPHRWLDNMSNYWSWLDDRFGNSTLRHACKLLDYYIWITRISTL